MVRRITAKEALEELINIKNEMEYNNNLDTYKYINNFEMAVNNTPIQNYA